MIERSSNPRKQGDAGLGLAIGWFASHGYSVSIPLTDSQRYDLVVDDGLLQTVQVKTTTSVKPSGRYKVTLRTKGGNRSGSGKVSFFDPLEVDLLFVVTATGDLYLIPSADVGCKSALRLGPRCDRFRVR